jgi:chaperonin GroEL
VRKAAFAPAIAIANNCGEQGNLIAEKIYERQGAWGFNGLTGEFADLTKEGVVDPVKVTKSAFTNAASVSGILLTVAAMITDKPQPKKAPAPSMDGMGGMGGMEGMM